MQNKYVEPAREKESKTLIKNYHPINLPIFIKIFIKRFILILCLITSVKA